eukprot:scaffold3139_cov110-Isochrysis_galbana.AAC.6
MAITWLRALSLSLRYYVSAGRPRARLATRQPVASHGAHLQARASGRAQWPSVDSLCCLLHLCTQAGAAAYCRPTRP